MNNENIIQDSCPNCREPISTKNEEDITCPNCKKLIHWQGSTPWIEELMTREEILTTKTKSVKMTGAFKATITILIREVQECKDMDEVNRLLDCWIEANDLHPEKVQTIK